jgi:hypothetical protein
MAEPRRTCREGTYALGALTLFALWLFVGLPVLYWPSKGTVQQQIHSSEPAQVGATEPDHRAIEGHDPLEKAYWISQIVLAGVATVAAVAAFIQIRTFKLFELLKYIESSKLRKSRRIVLREISKRRAEDWWDDADPKVRERLERAASDV